MMRVGFVIGALVVGLVVAFFAGSLSSRADVAILAGLMVCAAMAAWPFLHRVGRTRVLAAAAAGLVLVTIYAVWLNLPRAVPSDRQTFVGVWTAGPAFKIEIRQAGTVRIVQDRTAPGLAFERLGITVARDVIDSAIVRFDRDVMHVFRPMYEYGKDYTIDKAPFVEDGRGKMVLNGVVLVRE